MITRRAVIVFLSIGVVLCGPNLRAQPSPRDALNSLVSFLEARKVGRVELIGIPRDAETIVPLTPEALKKVWDFKITIKQLDLNSRDELLKELRSTAVSAAVRPSDGLADVRRGIVFYLMEGDTVFLSLFFDGAGTRGYVNAAQVRFEVGFLERVERALALSVEPLGKTPR